MRRFVDLRVILAAALFAALLFNAAPVAHGQAASEKAFTPADFEKVVVDDLKKKFKKKENADGFTYDIEATPYYALVNTKRKFIMFQVRIGGAKTPLETLNAWNKDALYSRAYRTEKEVIFEGAVSYATGLTAPSLVSLYRNLDEEWARFRKLIGK